MCLTLLLLLLLLYKITVVFISSACSLYCSISIYIINIDNASTTYPIYRTVLEETVQQSKEWLKRAADMRTNPAALLTTDELKAFIKVLLLLLLLLLLFLWCNQYFYCYYFFLLLLTIPTTILIGRRKGYLQKTTR